MRISRLRLQDFRGWSHLDLRPRTHVLFAGVPRAGRSDIIAALGRLLDPAAVRLHPVLTDIRQRRQLPAATPSDPRRDRAARLATRYDKLALTYRGGAA